MKRFDSIVFGLLAAVAACNNAACTQPFAPDSTEGSSDAGAGGSASSSSGASMKSTSSSGGSGGEVSSSHASSSSSHAASSTASSGGSSAQGAGGSGGASAGGASSEGGASSTVASASSTAMSSSSTGTYCTPGASQPCYDGPQGTEGVGICKAGMQSCLPDGSAYGECVGEVTPKPEDCTTPEDDDCDGTANQPSAGCVCTPGAMQPCYDGPSGTQGVGICTAGSQSCDASGKSWGACQGEVLPQKEDCTNNLDDDCDGSACSAPLYGKLFGDNALQIVEGIAQDAQGNTFVTGTFNGTINLGGNTLISAGQFDFFVAEFDAKGNHVWSKSFGGAGSEGALSIAVMPDGGPVVGGYFNQSFSIGGTGFNVQAGATEAGFVAHFSANGDLVWRDLFSASGSSEVTALAVAPNGNVAVTGPFQGNICGNNSKGLDDVFVATLQASNGSQTVCQVFGDAYEQWPLAVAVDPVGDTIVGGHYQGTLTNGASAPSGSTYGFLLRLDSNLKVASALSMTSTNASVTSIAADAIGSITYAGTFDDSMSYGGKTITSSASQSMYLAKVTAAGALNWMQSFGGTLAHPVLALDGKGDIAFAASSKGSVNFGGGAMNAAAIDPFVAKFGADGSFVWGKHLATNSLGSDYVATVSGAANGDLLVGGDMVGTLDFGQGALTSAGADDAFLGRFSN